MLSLFMPVALMFSGLAGGGLMIATLGGAPLLLILPRDRYVPIHQFLVTRFDPFMPLSMTTAMVFDLALATDSIQRKVIDFDPTGDTHYDVASAFIKSLRGSDPDAAVYWLARMLEGGEDPRFVARRLVIFAAEDVGNADPRGVLIANAAWDAVERVGLPECRINLAHAVCYLACAPKSNASYMAVEAALKDVREGRTLPVPTHLRDKRSLSGGDADRGAGYQYPHDFAGGWVEQEYVPTDAVYYEPTDRGFEAQLKARLDARRGRAPG